MTDVNEDGSELYDNLDETAFRTNQVLSVETPQDLGEWTAWKQCPLQLFVRSIQLFYNDNESNRMGIVGMALTCEPVLGEQLTTTELIGNDLYKNETVSCDSFMNGFVVESSRFMGCNVDNVAVVSVNFYCSMDDSSNTPPAVNFHMSRKSVANLDLQYVTSTISMCSVNTAFCGARMKLDYHSSNAGNNYAC
jgi:hypothetical protein